MELLEHLNDAQKAAVTASAPYLRIVAGAGSGKTRVLITRIAYLIGMIGVPPRNIVAITFTNKAAKEMQSRIIQLLEDKAAGVHISTIHSLCVTILRQDIQYLSYPRNFTVLDSDDQKSILKEAYKKLNIDSKYFSYSNALDYIGGNKGGDVSIEHAYELAGKNPYELQKAKVYEYYQNRLKALFALDFDDLLLFCVRLFKTNPQALQKWQRRFNYILVDEFQDVDGVQYEFIRLLAGERNEVYVVGDPDQTIYTWRGADVNIIMNFDHDFPGAQTIYLNENYRSSGHILRGANALIDNNRNRLKKDLFTRRENGHQIRYYSALNEEVEAQFICDTIQAEYKAGRKYRDIAVLYRSNYISRGIEKVLLERHIPYKIFGGMRFYDRAEIKDAISYLRLVCKGDDLAFTRVINTPKRGIGAKTLDTLVQQQDGTGKTLIEVASTQSELFSGKTKKELERFTQLVASWQEKMTAMKITELLELILQESGYKFMLEESKEIDRSENLKELLNDIMYFEKNNPEGTLDEYLQIISLYSDKDVYEEGDYVSLMTVHSAKGLEFDTVLVVSLSESVFPNERAMAEGSRGLEEERRLAYVAFTRAKRQLYLSDSQGFSFVFNGLKIPSRFIKEIDEECLEQIGIQPVKQKEPTITELGFSQDEIKKASKTRFKKSDVVVHSVFGEGIVIKADEASVTIAFAYPHGIKTLMTGHPSLQLKN